MTDLNTLLAYLSAYSYRVGIEVPARIGRPPDVEVIDSMIDSDSGFEASAFLYDGKIVISYAGTTDWRDGIADAALAAGAGRER